MLSFGVSVGILSVNFTAVSCQGCLNDQHASVSQCCFAVREQLEGTNIRTLEIMVKVLGSTTGMLNSILVYRAQLYRYC